jgi:hypothetical protein
MSYVYNIHVCKKKVNGKVPGSPSKYCIVSDVEFAKAAGAKQEKALCGKGPHNAFLNIGYKRITVFPAQESSAA